MNIKKHRFFILLYLFLFCLFTVSADAEANDRYLVIIVMDGCRADYLDLQPMPSLEELKKNGVYYSNAWVGLMMNNTPTAHAAIQTGLDPVNNGIIGFFWKEASGRKIWVKPSNWDNVLEGAQLDIMKSHSAFGFIGELKKKYPDFLAASVSGHKFYAAETFGGPSCDVIAFPSWGIERRLTEEQKQYGGWNDLLGEKNESIAKIMYAKGKATSSDVLNDPALKTLTHNFGDDESAVALALSIFKHQRPKALLINLPRLDHLGHFAAGGYRNRRKNIGEYMKTVDTLIGRIVDEYKKAGLLEKTVFIVLADHGMATNGKTISPEFVRKKLGKKATSSAARQHRSYIWSFNISEETLCGRAENLAKSNIKYLRAIYIKRKNDGRYSYKLIPYYTDRIESRLDEVYRFLLNTHANASSPDLYLTPLGKYTFSSIKLQTGYKRYA